MQNLKISYFVTGPRYYDNENSIVAGPNFCGFEPLIKVINFVVLQIAAS